MLRPVHTSRQRMHLLLNSANNNASASIENGSGPILCLCFYHHRHNVKVDVDIDGNADVSVNKTLAEIRTYLLGASHSDSHHLWFLPPTTTKKLFQKSY